MEDRDMRESACTMPEVRIAAPVLSKLAMAAGLEVSGIEDAEDYFLGAASGPAGAAALYLRFSTVPGADLPNLRRLLKEHVRERLRWFAGVEVDAIEVELVPGIRPLARRLPPCA